MISRLNFSGFSMNMKCRPPSASSIDSYYIISRAERLDLMFEFLGALGPAVDENDRKTTSLPTIA
jgi:hypothetical protein